MPRLKTPAEIRACKPEIVCPTCDLQAPAFPDCHCPHCGSFNQPLRELQDYLNENYREED